MVPDANPFVDNCTEYVLVYALVVILPPSQTGLTILLPVVGLVDNKVTVELGLVLVTIVLLNVVMIVDV
jgi:hypothetical protein